MSVEWIMNKRSVIASTILIPICSTSLGGTKAIGDFYIVKEGESFSKIAEKMRFTYRGWSFRKRFESLLKENPQISDVNKVFPGDKLSLPSKDEESIKIQNLSSNEDINPKIVITNSSRVPQEKVEKIEKELVSNDKKSLDKNYKLYYVKKGETLSQIAQKTIGKPVFDNKIGSLQLLLRYNMQIKSPDNIEVGDKIFIPSLEEIELYKFLKTREAKAKKKNPSLGNNKLFSKPKIIDYLPEKKEVIKTNEKVWVKKLLQGDEHLNFLWCSPNCK